MQKNKLAAALLLTGFFAAAVASQSFASSESDFTPLFDGQTLSGWTEVKKSGSPYYVENGCIVSPEKGNGDLFSDKDYADFVLRLDFKLTPGANNGIGLRAPFEKGQVAYIGNEIQVLDDTAPEYDHLKKGQNCGSLYRVIEAKRGALKKIGEWNSYEITAQGRHIKVVLNGKTVVNGSINDVNDPEIIAHHPGMLREKGRIGFLGHDSRVDFRNIRIKELPQVEKDNTPPEGFTSLFDGVDLNGWKGLVLDPPKRALMSAKNLTIAQVGADLDMRTHWSVEDGVIVFDGHGQNLCTHRDYTNFEMLVDWKIPAKGDSGIYLRGSPQVQIWEPKSPGQFSPADGSGGLYNNEKNSRHPSRVADHPPGEWNRFRILMEGEKVHVFLNDQLVVNNVTLENYWDRSQPIYPFGQIELQNHGGKLWFKNIYIREIADYQESAKDKARRLAEESAPAPTPAPKRFKAAPAPKPVPAPVAQPAPKVEETPKAVEAPKPVKVKPVKAPKPPKAPKAPKPPEEKTEGRSYKNIFTGETIEDK